MCPSLINKSCILEVYKKRKFFHVSLKIITPLLEILNQLLIMVVFLVLCSNRRLYFVYFGYLQYILSLCNFCFIGITQYVQTTFSFKAIKFQISSRCFKMVKCSTSDTFSYRRLQSLIPLEHFNNPSYTKQSGASSIVHRVVSCENRQNLI